MNNKIRNTAIYIVYITLFFVICSVQINNKVQMKIKYSNNCDGQTSQLYFDLGDGYSEENSSKNIIKDQYSIIDINKKYFSANAIRLDPTIDSKEVSIESIEVHVSGNKNVTISGDELKGYISGTENIADIISEDDQSILIIPSNNDIQIYLDKNFSALYNNMNKENWVLKVALLIFITILFVIIRFKINIITIAKKNKKLVISMIGIMLFCINLYQWYISNVLYNEKYIMRSIFILILYVAGMFFCVTGWKKSGEIIFDNRYKIAIGLFLFCLIFKLNGSSIALWQQFLPDSDLSNGTILGQARGIRGDEWAVRTPMSLSQVYNKFGYFSNIMRADETDMFVVSAQPVFDLALIFRPFYLGYLFLGFERGLSFFWYGKIIALFMVTFEFGLLMTNKNK